MLSQHASAVQDWSLRNGLFPVFQMYSGKMRDVGRIFTTPEEDFVQTSWDTLLEQHPCLTPIQLRHLLNNTLHNAHQSCTSENYISDMEDILERFDKHPPVTISGDSNYQTDLREMCEEGPLRGQILKLKKLLECEEDVDMDSGVGAELTFTPSPSIIHPQPEATTSSALDVSPLLPDESSSSEVSPSPEVSSSPQVSPSPEVSSSPQVSPSPEVSSPEVSSPEVSSPEVPLSPELESIKVAPSADMAAQSDDMISSSQGLDMKSQMEGTVAAAVLPRSELAGRTVENTFGVIPEVAWDYSARTRFVRIEKGPKGFGIGFVDGKHMPGVWFANGRPRSSSSSPSAGGLIVRTVAHGSPADGLVFVGDRVVALNGEHVADAPYRQTMLLVRNARSSLRMSVQSSHGASGGGGSGQFK